MRNAIPARPLVPHLQTPPKWTSGDRGNRHKRFRVGVGSAQNQTVGKAFKTNLGE
jgi:hypothetical protein